MRDQVWLQNQFDQLFQSHFSDVEKVNPLSVSFGRAAKRRLGSIRLTRDHRSHVLVNGLLRDPAVPEQIICSVIAHELCHYVHGFCSSHPKKYKSPHAHGVIERELKKRGLHFLHEYEKMWLKNHWADFLKKHGIRGVSSPLLTKDRWFRSLLR